MLDIQLLRSQFDQVAERIATRGATLDASGFQALEERAQGTADPHTGAAGEAQLAVQADRAAQSQGRGYERAHARGRRPRRPSSRPTRTNLPQLLGTINDFVAVIPNLPHASVPVGTSAADNVEVRRWGTPRNFDFPVKDHVDLGDALGGLDFDSRRQDHRRALLAHDAASSRGCIARLPSSCSTCIRASMATPRSTRPTWSMPRSLRGTGQLPKFEEDLFARAATGRRRTLYLIPTAEVPVTNIVRDEILPTGRAAAEVRLPHAVLPLARPAPTARTRAA